MAARVKSQRVSSRSTKTVQGGGGGEEGGEEGGEGGWEVGRGGAKEGDVNWDSVRNQEEGMGRGGKERGKEGGGRRLQGTTARGRWSRFLWPGGKKRREKEETLKIHRHRARTADLAARSATGSVARFLPQTP